MIITINYLSELLNRQIADEDNEVLDGIKRTEVEDIKVIYNTEKKTVIKFTISSGKGFDNTIHAGEVWQLVIVDNEVYDIEDYKESDLVVTATDEAVEVEFCDAEGVQVKGEVKPYQRPTVDANNKYNGYEDTIRCHWDLHRASNYSLGYEVPEDFYSLEFKRENILKAINQLSAAKYKGIVITRKYEDPEAEVKSVANAVD